MERWELVHISERSDHRQRVFQRDDVGSMAPSGQLTAVGEFGLQCSAIETTGFANLFPVTSL